MIFLASEAQLTGNGKTSSFLKYRNPFCETRTQAILTMIYSHSVASMTIPASSKTSNAYSKSVDVAVGVFFAVFGVLSYANVTFVVGKVLIASYCAYIAPFLLTPKVKATPSVAVPVRERAFWEPVVPVASNSIPMKPFWESGVSAPTMTTVTMTPTNDSSVSITSIVYKKASLVFSALLDVSFKVLKSVVSTTRAAITAGGSVISTFSKAIAKYAKVAAFSTFNAFAFALNTLIDGGKKLKKLAMDAGVAIYEKSTFAVDFVSFAVLSAIASAYEAFIDGTTEAAFALAIPAKVQTSTNATSTYATTTNATSTTTSKRVRWHPDLVSIRYIKPASEMSEDEKSAWGYTNDFKTKFSLVAPESMTPNAPQKVSRAPRLFIGLGVVLFADTSELEEAEEDEECIGTLSDLDDFGADVGFYTGAIKSGVNEVSFGADSNADSSTALIGLEVDVATSTNNGLVAEDNESEGYDNVDAVEADFGVVEDESGDGYDDDGIELEADEVDADLDLDDIIEDTANFPTNTIDFDSSTEGIEVDSERVEFDTVASSLNDSVEADLDDGEESEDDDEEESEDNEGNDGELEAEDNEDIGDVPSNESEWFEALEGLRFSDSFGLAIVNENGRDVRRSRRNR